MLYHCFLPNRLAIVKLLPVGGVGVEVGVFLGDFSALILEYSGLKLLYSVDCWLDGPVNRSLHYHFTANKLMQFGDRSRILRARSANAVRHFADESLDFVYIDADHSYEQVKLDLTLWNQKIKKNGIIAGHDYNQVGVATAVHEFADFHGFRPHYVGIGRIPRDRYECNSPSWIIFKAG